MSVPLAMMGRMDVAVARAERLRSHRLSAPAATLADVGAHMLAVQAQDFAGARWALAVRTRGDPTVSDVDAAFDRGELVRSWTMRGTIHVIPTRDLSWVLALTGERQLRTAAGVHRAEGIDEAEIARAETATMAALAGGNRLTRDELFAVLEQAGISTRGQRGYHVLVALSVRGVVCQGPVVARSDGPTREQSIVRTDEWATDAASPADPLAEMFVRYVASHGPAGPRDFAWWAGLPLGVARAAAEAASDRLRIVDAAPPAEGLDEGRTPTAVAEPVYLAAAPAARRTGRAPRVLALPAFDEYYLPYADRTVPCAREALPRIGPGRNGMVRPILVADGEIVGVWTHSRAVGRLRDEPVPELFAAGGAPADDVAAALSRYARFLAA
ncbi:winged helix DNA-binding domain-containing protein [Microbacterium sp. P02]|uniref:winged helix DNA-binding domain-containing protein n=1 Tax=Microbacterium sp. P02 TaxID=3366260 RepID=UPI00366D6A19